MDCSQQTAKKAWFTGWPEHEWAKPIQPIWEERINGKKPENPAPVDRAPAVEAEFTDAEIERAVNPANPDLANPPKTVEHVRMMGVGEVQRMLDNAVLQVKANVAQALQAEQEMIGIARNNLKGILVASDKMLTGLMKLADSVSERLAQMALATNVNPAKVLGYMDRLIKINASAVQAAAKLVEIQRLLVGAPQSITESRTTEKPAPPPSEGSKRDELERMLEEAKRRALAAVAHADPVGEQSTEEEPSSALT